MSDGRIPKDLLYGELDHGLRPVGRPKLRFKDTCKQDIIEIGLDVENWETLAADRGRWRINCSACLDEGELRIRKEANARRERRKVALNAPPALVFVCSGCSGVCSSRIGLFSHQSRCRNMRCHGLLCLKTATTTTIIFNIIVVNIIIITNTHFHFQSENFPVTFPIYVFSTEKYAT